MNQIKPRYPLYLKKSGRRGWGVFCRRPIPEGAVFEVAPIIYLPRKFWFRLSDTPIESYRFTFFGRTSALVLGYGSLYNHSSTEANCEWDVHPRSRTYSFTATKRIPAHTEICHNYHWEDEHYEKRGMPAEKKKSKKTRKTPAKTPSKKPGKGRRAVGKRG